jgi:hypothetical protein
MNEAGALYFPIRLRCTAVADLIGSAGLEAALARALGRCFAHARQALPASAAIGGGVALQPPSVTRGGLSAPDAAQLLAKVQRAIAVAARRAALPIAATGYAAPMSRATVSERFDRARFDAQSETYVVPSYDGGKARIAVDAGRTENAAPDWASLAARLRRVSGRADDAIAVDTLGAVYDLQSRALAWDKYAIAMLMLAVRADGSGPTWLVLRILRTLARQDAGRLRTILRELRLGYESVHAASYQRGDDDVTILPAAGVTTEAVRQLEDILGGLAYVARAIPETQPIAAEWQRRRPGFARVAALLQTLAEARAALSRYLVAPLGSPSPRQLPGPPNAAAMASFEHTDPDLLASLVQVTAHLLRYQAVALLDPQQSGLDDFAYQLELDLVANIRWIEATLDRVQSIDAMLAGLRLLSGPGADKLEEAKVLREIRADLLATAAQSPLPTAARATALHETAEKRFADWIGTTADRRLAGLRKNVSALMMAMGPVPSRSDPSKKVWPTAPSPYSEAALLNNDELIFSSVDYDWNRGELGTDIYELKNDVAAPWTGPRDESYLAAVNALEARATIAAARIAVISVWRVGVQIQWDVLRGDIGTADEQKSWLGEAARLHREANAQYAKPDIGSLRNWVQSWAQRLDNMNDLIRDAIRRENNRRILMALAALVATAITGGALAGLGVSALTITIGEATTFTAVSTIATPLVLGKPVQITEVVSQFGLNIATFGTFRILDFGIAAGAGRLFPRNAFAQLGVIFGGQLLAATGVPLLLSYVENGKFPDDLVSFLMPLIVLGTLGALLGAPDVMARIRQQQLATIPLVAQLYDTLVAIRREADGIIAQLRDPLVRGRMTKPEWEALRQRGVLLSNEMAATLRRLAAPDIADAQLAALGLTRRYALSLADINSQYGALLPNAEFSGGAGAAALPAPQEVIGEEGVIVTGNQVEYNPNAAGMEPTALVRRFRAAGYQPTEDAGVIRLLAPGEDTPRYVMVPTVPDMPAPALARLVTPLGAGAAEVLRRSQTNVAIGLRSLQTQTAVPALEQMITAMAKNDEENATGVLDGLGRYFKSRTINEPDAVLGWKGIANFFEIGGSLKMLATILKSGGDYTIAVGRVALGRFTTLRATDLAGIDWIIKKNRNVLDRIIGIASGFVEPNVVFAGINLLESRTESGFDQLVDQLASANAVERQKAAAAMDEAIAIVVQSPTRRLRFVKQTIDGQETLTVRFPGETGADYRARLDAVARGLAQPLGSGLDIFAGTPSDVGAAVERLGQAKGGKFSDRAERAAFEKTVAHFRDMIDRLHQGTDVIRNAVGDRREINAVTSAVILGGEVFANGNGIRITINPGLFELKPGLTLINFPETVAIQIDLGQKLDGKIIITEVTAARLFLPDALRGLLPGGAPGTIDMAALKGGATPEEEASNRKWLQMFKLRAAALFAQKLLEAFRVFSDPNATIALPEMVMQVKGAEPDAVIGAAQLGFRIERGSGR